MAVQLPEFKIALGMCLTGQEMRDNRIDVDCLNDITDNIWNYLCRVLSHPTRVGRFTPRVDWAMTAADITNTDLVVYFVLNTTKSIILDQKRQLPPGDIGGATSFGAGLPTISEVYVENNLPSEKLANIAFHELMHNKLQQDNSMHNTKGLGIGVSPANECSLLSTTDVSLMANALMNLVPQYTARLTGDVAAKFVNPQQAAPVAKFTCSNGNVPFKASSPSALAGQRTVDWSRAKFK